MKKPKVVIPDWVLGGVVTVLLLLATLTAWWPIETMEMKVYDLRARMRANGQVGQEIVVQAGIGPPGAAKIVGGEGERAEKGPTSRRHLGMQTGGVNL